MGPAATACRPLAVARPSRARNQTDKTAADTAEMLNLAINRHGDLALLQVEGDLDTFEAIDDLGDSLLFATADDELVLDLTSVSAMDDESARDLHDRLVRRCGRLPATIIAPAVEVQLALAANGFDELAAVVDTLELARDVVRARNALDDILANWRCSASRRPEVVGPIQRTGPAQSIRHRHQVHR